VVAYCVLPCVLKALAAAALYLLVIRPPSQAFQGSQESSS
jgi:hypothetical protein